METIEVGSLKIGPDQPLVIIAGPCMAESLELCLTVGRALRDCCAQLDLGYIFKASFDKANRTSIGSNRGPGLVEGLDWIGSVRDTLAVGVTTDIHEPDQAPQASQIVDLLQIPAFLCRQTDLLLAAAQTGKPVNVKKGQFVSPGEMSNVVSKLTNSGSGSGVMLTERGTFFGYHRLVNDFVGLGDLMELGWPVCFDITHSTQEPGGEGHRTGGRPDRAPLLARCAVVAGVQSLFFETHPDPVHAQSDASVMLPLDGALKMLEDVARLKSL